VASAIRRSRERTGGGVRPGLLGGARAGSTLARRRLDEKN